MTKKQLTHFNAQGEANMVDIGDKPVTIRTAVAQGFVRCHPDLIRQIRNDTVAKGNVCQTARIAGIQAAKRTDELIPLCHSLPLDNVQIDLDVQEQGVAIRAEARTSWKTGVEMEALTAVSVAALTIIDMGKAIDKRMTIESVYLVSKTGGKSGDFHRNQDQT